MWDEWVNDMQPARLPLVESFPEYQDRRLTAGPYIPVPPAEKARYMHIDRELKSPTKCYKPTLNYKLNYTSFPTHECHLAPQSNHK